jgi:threonyl-tRNA synthetase
MLIVGENEAQNGTVSVRKRGDGDLGSMSMEAFKELLQNEINKELNQH